MISFYLFQTGVVLLCFNFVRLKGLAVSDCFFLAAVVAAVLETYSGGSKYRRCWVLHPMIFPAFFVMAGFVVSSYQSGNVVSALIEAIQLLYTLTLFLSVLCILVQRGYLNQIVNAIILSGFIAAVIGLMEAVQGQGVLNYLPDYGYHFYPNNRVAGPLGHPNKLGYFLVLSSTLTMVKGLSLFRKSGELFFLALWGVQILGILLSGSVTAFLGLGFSVLLLFMRSRQTRIRLTKWLLIFLYTLTCISIILYSDPVYFFSSVLDEVSVNISRVTEVTGSIRMDTYALALDKIASRPFSGYGFDQFSTSGISASERLLPASIHNIFLQVLYAGGLFAFLGILLTYVLVAYMAIAILMPGRKVDLLSLGLASSSLSIILMDQFQDSVYQREKWIIFGLILAIVQIGKRNDFFPRRDYYSDPESE